MARPRKQSEKVEAPAEVTIKKDSATPAAEPVVQALPKEVRSMLETTEDLAGIVANLQKEFDTLKAEYLAKLNAGENPASIGILMLEKTLEMSAILFKNITYFTTSIPALLATIQAE